MKKNIFLLVIVALVASCASPVATPISTKTQVEIPNTNEQPTPTPTKTQVEFLVHVPDNTPAADTIYLVQLPFGDWDELERIPMTARGDGTWWASAELEEGSLIRYAYDRGLGDGSEPKAKREWFSGEVQILYRYLFVSPATSSVEDTVAMWSDIPSTPLTGTVSGIITDRTTGKPIMDATVSIGGVHIATNYDGSFTLRDVPAGNQRVTALTTLGDYKYASTVVQVNRDETSTIAFDLEPARKVEVTFNVQTPSDTPPNAVVRLVGNVFQMGSYPGPYLNYGFTRWSPSRQVFMNRVTQNSFTATVELFEGSYIQYLYTLGYISFGDEKNPTGEPMLRSFIVGAADETRNERIAAWRAPGQVAITFKVTVPINTPPTSMVFMDIGGPYVAMDRVSENQWALTFFTYPDWEFQYKYFHSTGPIEMERFEPDDPEAFRTIMIPGEDTEIDDVVERWKWYPQAVEPAAGTPISATFRVTVPLNTPAGDTVYLVGDSHELGSDLDPNAVPMTQVPTNPWLWEATVTFDSAKNVTYRYTRGAFTNTESETRTLDIAYDGQSVNDAVFSWVDIPFSLSREFVAAIYPDDLWDPEFLPLYEPTLSSIKSLNAQYVVVSSVWSYGQVEPLPEVEPRPIKAPSVFTPTEDLIATIDMAHSMGLKVFIEPQFNMEMTPGGEMLGGPQSNEWWDKWLEEAEKLYLYNAEIAQRTGAEMLLLPGPVFHVFPSEYGFEDPSYISVFDQKMMDLIGKVRQHYSGLLLVNGAQYSLYDFPSLADYVVITAFDWGMKLNVSSDASVQEIKRALENTLDRYARPMSEKYNKPVIVQLTYSSVDGAANGVRGDSLLAADDPTTVLDLIEQANIYEAFFQAIIDRPWVGGMFDYSYHLLDLPEDEGESIRAKPAEAVLSKYYHAFEQP
jgi:hypothetical protein